MNIYAYVYVHINEIGSVSTIVQALAICIHTYIYLHTLHHGDECMECISMYAYMCV